MVLGAGPGLGAAVAARFAAAGYAVGLVARSPARLDELADTLRADGARVRTATADLTDVTALEEAVRHLAAEAGGIDVLHFNPSAFRATDLLALTAAELLEDVALGAAALLTAVQAARPWLRPGSRVVATGSAAADHPSPKAPSLGVQKAALRNLVLSLDATLAPEGVRAVVLQVNGVLGRGAFVHERVARAVHEAVLRDDASWTAQVSYDG